MLSTHSSRMSTDTDASITRAAVRDLIAERSGREWCLFLDRDGVINRRIAGDYVRDWQQFEWLPGAQAAVRILRQWAPHLVVVTNQQGVGKGLMSLDDVGAIHARMADELAEGGTSVDAFQVCPHLASEGCMCRKPHPGMVVDWLGGHPDNESMLSVVVGDSASDLELARNVAVITGGCVAVHITNGGAQGDADLCFASLLDFAAEVAHAREEELE